MHCDDPVYFSYAFLLLVLAKLKLVVNCLEFLSSSISYQHLLSYLSHTINL